MHVCSPSKFIGPKTQEAVCHDLHCPFLSLTPLLSLYTETLIMETLGLT